MKLDIKKQINALWRQYGTPPNKGREMQVAALPFAIKKGQLQIMLITSRDTGRWVLPKGWPHKGLSDAESAMTEAWEEAGLKGNSSKKPCGSYEYVKITDGKKDNIDCSVLVFPLEVTSQENKFPEKGQREFKWFTPAEAAKAVNEKSLAKLLRAFGKEAREVIAA